MKKSDEKLGVKIKKGLTTLKSHWSKPPEGYYVCYKELLFHSLGQGSISFAAILSSWTLLGITVPMMIGYFKVSSGFVFIGGVIASIIGLIRAPILAMLIDNSNSKKGKFKPFLPISAIIMTVCFCIIPFIPESLVDTPWFSIHLPSIPVLNVENSIVEVSVGVAIMFVFLQVATFFHTMLTQCLMGIEQTISPVSQERANVTAFRAVLSNLPGSIVNVIIPIVAGLVFAECENPMNQIELYRWAFPLCGIGCVAFVFFEYYGVEERTILEKDHVAKITFGEGIKELFFNKYFWILMLFAVLTAVRSAVNLVLWICNYAIGGKNGSFVFAICQVVLNNAFVPGMLLGPLFIKKMGKRNVMFMSTIGFTVVTLIQLMCINQPYLMLVCVFFQNLFAGFNYVSTVMAPDVLDYQQWKTGKRLEGFWQNMNNFILTFFGIFTSVLVPVVLSISGIGFGDNIDLALQDSVILHDVFKNVTVMSLIASALSIVPFLLYDLSEKQHAKYIIALEIRAIVKNFDNNNLTNEDIEKLSEIVSNANENNDEFVLNELNSHDSINAILSCELATN